MLAEHAGGCGKDFICVGGLGGFPAEGIEEMKPRLARAKGDLSLPALGDVLGEGEKVFGLPVLVGHRQFPRLQEPFAAVPRVDGFFRSDLHSAAPQDFAVAGDKKVGLLLGEEIIVGLANKFAAVDTQQFLAGAVDEDKAKICGILHEDHCRNVIDHNIIESTFLLEDIPRFSAVR